MHEELLMKAGLGQREVKVYATLLSDGEMMASAIAKKTGLIRTNAYDVLNSLIKKGIISYVIRNGRKYFKAALPEKLIDYIENQKKELQEIEDEISCILKELKPVNLDSERPSIEIYEGREGMKTILAMSVRESLKTKKEILGISVQQQKCRELSGAYHIRWYKDREKYKINSRYLMSSEEKLISVKFTKFKTLPKEAKNPNEVFIFGDYTTQFFFIGGLFTAIVIKNTEITNRYRDYFDFLWKLV